MGALLTLDHGYNAVSLAAPPAAAYGSANGGQAIVGPIEALADSVGVHVVREPKRRSSLAGLWIAQQVSRSFSQYSDTSGNPDATSNTYYEFDDYPHAILGLASPSAVFGRAGYWHALDEQVQLQTPGERVDVNNLVLRLSEYATSTSSGSTMRVDGVLADVATTMQHLAYIVREPVVEVDEDGLTDLLWETEEKSFALTFNGDGRVIGSLSPRQHDYEAWTMAVDDTGGIVEKISAAQVSYLLA